MVDVPIGGTIRNHVTWDAVVMGQATGDFYVSTVYGTDVDGTEANFIKIHAPVSTYVPTATASNIETDVDYVVGIDAGTYDALTVIVEFWSGDILDHHIDIGQLTVLPQFDATIVSTAFSIV